MLFPATSFINTIKKRLIYDFEAKNVKYLIGLKLEDVSGNNLMLNPFKSTRHPGQSLA